MRELIGEYFNVLLEAITMSIFVSVIIKLSTQFLGISV